MNTALNGLRQELLNSYRHKQFDDLSCVFCARRGGPIALHVVEFYHPEKVRTPRGLVPMSKSRDTIRGSVPICIRCSRPCSKCALPISTPWTSRMIRALQSRHREVTIRRGNGICRNHFHVVADVFSLLRRAHLPASDDAVVGDPYRRALAALKAIESGGDAPVLNVIRNDVLALLADREKTTASIIEDGLSPEALIYFLIRNVTTEHVCSGRHHVYRGVLSFTGTMLFNGFRKASERLVELGVSTQEKHAADVAELRQSIKQAG